MGKFNLWGGIEGVRFVYAFDSDYLLGIVNTLLIKKMARFVQQSYEK
jgi:hypothetical protein